MPWFWFILMLAALGFGPMTDSADRFAFLLPAMGESEARPLVLLGPVMCVLLVTKAWMFYIGRHVESGDLSYAAASKMWESGLRWATLLGATFMVLLEPLAGIDDYVHQARSYSETLAAFLTLWPILLFAMMMDCLAYQWEQYGSQHRQDAVEVTLEKPLLFLWHRAQLSWLLPLFPMLVSCLGIDLLRLMVAEDTLQRWSILLVPLLSLLVAILVGSMLLSLWTVSLSQAHPQGTLWLQLFREVGVPIRDIRLWRTGQRINNAMLLGFLPGFRYVILTDRLLQTLTSRELEMVLLHEAAHCKCWHGLKRSLGLSLGLVALGVVFQLCGGWGASIVSRGGAGGTNVLGWSLGYGLGSFWGLCVGGGLLGHGVRWIWHQTELEADRVACQLSVLLRKKEYPADVSTELGLWNERRQHWKSAMELSTALYNLVGSERRAVRDTWTHPSVKSRVQKLAERFDLEVS